MMMKLHARLPWLLTVLVWLCATTFVPQVTFAYDGHSTLAADGTLQAGQAGRFSMLEGRAVVGDSLTPHHMPQAALGFTTRAEGGAIMIGQSEHVLTRTYGFGGTQLATA